MNIKCAHYPLVTGGKTPPLRVRDLWENGNLFLNIAYFLISQNSLKNIEEYSGLSTETFLNLLNVFDEVVVQLNLCK